MSTKFEVTRRVEGKNISGIYDSAAPRGLGLGAHATDATKFNLAQHNTFLGVLTRDVKVGGLTLSDRVFGVTSDDPVGLESPFTAGQEVSLEKAQEAELEGADYLVLSGTGAISGSTAVGTSLSYLNGRLRQSQTGEIVNGVLTAQLPPIDSGGVRIRVEFI